MGQVHKDIAGKPSGRLWVLQSQESGIVSPTNSGQCDCDCDCACPYPFYEQDSQEEIAYALESSKSPLQLANNLHVQREGQYVYLVPPQAPGVMVCESQILERLLTERTLTSGLAWMAALLLQAGALTGSRGNKLKSLPTPKPSEPLTAWLSLNEACNLACPYCYIQHRPQTMTQEIAAQAVQSVFNSAITHQYNQVRLKYAGGEPTLNFSTLLAAQVKAEQLADKTGIHLQSVMLTNGVHLTSPMIDALAEHKINVMLSLDGIAEVQDRSRPRIGGRGSFQQVEKTLKRLIQAGLYPYISVTITNINLDRLPELVQYLLEHELRFSLNFYRPVGATGPLSPTTENLIEGLKRVYREIEYRLPRYSLAGGLTDRANLLSPHAYTCQAGRSYLVIDASGQIAACQMDMDHPVTSIASADPLGVLLNDHVGLQNLPVWEKDCQDCPFSSRCTGGCPRQTYQQTGRYDSSSPLCKVYKQILPEVVRLEALRLLHHETPIKIDIK